MANNASELGPVGGKTFLQQQFDRQSAKLNKLNNQIKELDAKKKHPTILLVIAVVSAIFTALAASVHFFGAFGWDGKLVQTEARDLTLFLSCITIVYAGLFYGLRKKNVSLAVKKNTFMKQNNLNNLKQKVTRLQKQLDDANKAPPIIAPQLEVDDKLLLQNDN